MTALFINLKIDEKEKFDFFKVTLLDIERLFNECHIKIRGNFADDCILFSKKLLSGRAKFYQQLQEKDWVAATLEMIESVKSSSIFIYIEDHKLISSSNDLKMVLNEFDKFKLDYLCYTFFSSSHLNKNNLLPLKPKHGPIFSEFFLDKKNIKVLKNISPLYCTFSFASICSKEYFEKLIHDENKKIKIYIRKLSSLLTIIFPYPKYKIIVNFLNFFLSFLNSRLCIYPINSPFNIEKLNIEMNRFEIKSHKKNWKIGVLNKELFANFDDDNNAYGESLIKRGLYPFDSEKVVNIKMQSNISYNLKLSKGDFYDCTYYSQIHRIRNSPRIFIKVLAGKLKVNYVNKDIILEKDEAQGFYSNLSPIINCIKDAEIQLSIYDESFK